MGAKGSKKVHEEKEIFEDLSEMKVVVVGSHGVGKTCLVMRFVTGKFPEDFIPSVFDNNLYPYTMKDGNSMDISFWDTAAHDEYHRLRPLSYPGAHLFLILGSVVDPLSFQNAGVTWLPEVSHHCPNAHIILVGTKSDLRDDEETLQNLKAKKMSPISRDKGHKWAKEMGAACYVEVSALRGDNLEELMDQCCLAVTGVTPFAGMTVKKAK
mmetsp:Transcript_23807/g.37091  ORF Transcript_23807/g.37091 Transcript_23807/m.37091 type:complete len:211 (-) Transcript_23807:19-651(-)